MTIEISELASFLGRTLPGRLLSPVDGFSGYLVTDRGEVLSLVRKTPRLLSPIRLGEYEGFQLRNDAGETKKRYRHRLVAEAFLGKPKDGEVARHLNGQWKDSFLGNVAWGTHKENAADKLRHGTDSKGERNGMAKLTESDVKDIRRMHSDGSGRQEIMKSFGISAMTHWRVVNRKLWDHVD